MPATAVIGVQWGDEGKGKIVDLLAQNHKFVARYQGGGNAGHVLYVNGRKYVMHLVPSGILHENTTCLIGHGVVLDLEKLRTELSLLTAAGIDHAGRLKIDHDTRILLPLHRLLDGRREARLGDKKVGTTGSGIGPCYADFALREGLRARDLVTRETIEAALNRGDYYDMRAEQLTGEAQTKAEVVRHLWTLSQMIVPLLTDTRRLVHEALVQSEHVLFEGAQAELLDLYHGTYPYVTSSLCGRAGISASFGIYDFKRVIGVAKAYATRVGNGPFPTELHGDACEELRTKGHEFGSTTGRSRRCGWLDLVALRWACRIGGITELCVTKLDTFSGLNEIKVGIAYDNAAATSSMTCEIMEDAEPRYKTMSGWGHVEPGTWRTMSDLPSSARMYLQLIADYVAIPITMIGVGPERAHTIPCMIMPRHATVRVN